MIRRRALTLLIIVLLIGVPAGYLVISANQSRDSGKDKEDEVLGDRPHRGLALARSSAASTRCPSRQAQPTGSRTTRRTTGRPAGCTSSSAPTRRASTSSSRTSASSRDALKKDDVTISARDQKVVGWEFTGPGPVVGPRPQAEGPRAHPGHRRELSEPRPPHGVRRLAHDPLTGPRDGAPPRRRDRLSDPARTVEDV